MDATDSQLTWIKKAAAFYRKLGWNPLPSRSNSKRPALVRYSECFDNLLDDRAYLEWGDGVLVEKHGNGNIQIVTGVKWNLAVIDCDGREGALEFMRLTDERGDYGTWGDSGDAVPPWIVKSGGGGLHFWYSLPPDLLWLNSKRLWGVWEPTGGEDWKGAWKKRSSIELIADNKLIVAPPSLHPITGIRYEWFDDYNPRHHSRPGVIPDWILQLPEFMKPIDETVLQAPQGRLKEPENGKPSVDGVEYGREEVLAAITNKSAVAEAWRLELVGEPNAEGWISCHAVNQASPGSRSSDRNPSASFHADKGIYIEMYGGSGAMSLFDLGVYTGHYPDWRSCLNDLGSKFGAVPYNGNSKRIDC